MTMMIIYHSPCWDGFCSAWLCHHVWPDAEFVPANYGKEPPDVTGKDVLIVDFSYDRNILLDMKSRANSLQVLDHHDTAREKLAGLDFCLFDMDRSGARLTWDYLLDKQLLDYHKQLLDYRKFVSNPMPGAGRRVHWLVAYVEDRDLWRKALPYSNEVNAAIRSYPLHFEVWNQMMDWPLERLIAEGTGIVRYKQEIIDHHLHYLQWVSIGDLTGKGVSCSIAGIWSDIMDQMMDREPDLPFVIIWQDTVDGIRLYSIRTPKNGQHAGKIAQRLGGGGHAHSAGFRLSIHIDILGDGPIHTKIDPPTATP